MITLTGHYYDGRHPSSMPARMDFLGQESILTANQLSERYPVNQLCVSPRIGRADRFITLPNGAQFQCEDHVFLYSLPQESSSESFVAWLEERWGVALSAVVVIAGILLAGYFFGLPIAAERIAAHIPIETEQALGQQALTWIDNKEWFKPTAVDQKKQKIILAGFDLLCADLPLKDHYKLAFRSAPLLGPNAFAFPGGTIVITDELVKIAKKPEEIFAVLAHEIGHVELRHTMRSVLQNSAVAVLAATVTSDAASLSVAVASLPLLFAQAKYSREFESAADEYAFRLMKQKGYSPAAFASIMEKLSKDFTEMESQFSYISSHPVTAERIERARATTH
jgi:predicted Zn-dependent protease